MKLAKIQVCRKNGQKNINSIFFDIGLQTQGHSIINLSATYFRCSGQGSPNQKYWRLVFKCILS